MFAHRCINLIAYLQEYRVITKQTLHELSEKNECSIFALYREVSSLIKEEKVKKVNVLSQYKEVKVVDYKSRETEVAFILNYKLNDIPVFSDDELSTLLD